jgi:electron transfer flavoprotein alpha/beta subunit
MLESKTIETALSLISRDESKVMALSIGPHASVGAKQYIPRAGERDSDPHVAYCC